MDIRRGSASEKEKNGTMALMNDWRAGSLDPRKITAVSKSKDATTTRGDDDDDDDDERINSLLY